jgi:hypothetical protein
MLIKLRSSIAPRKGRYWFAWRPVWTQDGYLAWLEVVRIDTGYACGEGAWTRYYLANPI